MPVQLEDNKTEDNLKSSLSTSVKGTRINGGRGLKSEYNFC